MKKMLVLPVFLLLMVNLAACQKSGPSGAMLSQAERKAVLEFSETKVDNLLEGWNEDNYEIFAQDFSQDLLKTMTPEKYEKLRNDEFTGLGRYYSREVEGVVQRSDRSYTVIYYVVFGNDDEVLMRVTLQADEPHKISGLQFEK